jgi:hypothetical protein
MHRQRALVHLVCAASVLAACGESFHAADPGTTGGQRNEAGQASGSSAGGSPEHAGESNGGAPQPGATDGGAGADAGLGGAGADAGAGDAGMGGVAPEEPPTCQSSNTCAKGENCVDALCVPALATCAAQKNKYPASKDGVYWVGTGAGTHRAYCDMAEVVELCSDSASERVGRTRDSSKLEYKMTSVLLADGSCKMWNMRSAADGYPLSQLKKVAGVPAAQTCIKLGFVADGVLGDCSYGSSLTNCGYAVMPLNRYGNNCSGCVLNDGDFDHWVVQGPVISGDVLSDAAGKVFTTCKTRK